MGELITYKGMWSRLTPEFSAAALGATDNGAVFSNVRETINFKSR